MQHVNILERFEDQISKTSPFMVSLQVVVQLSLIRIFDLPASRNCYRGL